MSFQCILCESTFKNINAGVKHIVRSHPELEFGAAGRGAYLRRVDSDDDSDENFSPLRHNSSPPGGFQGSAVVSDVEDEPTIAAEAVPANAAPVHANAAPAAANVIDEEEKMGMQLLDVMKGALDGLAREMTKVNFNWGGLAKPGECMQAIKWQIALHGAWVYACNGARFERDHKSLNLLLRCINWAAKLLSITWRLEEWRSLRPI